MLLRLWRRLEPHARRGGAGSHFFGVRVVNGEGKKTVKWVQKKGARRRGKKKISKPRQTTTLTPPQKTFFLLSLLLEGTIAGFIVPISRECTFSPKPRRRECEGVRAKGRPRGSEGASKNRAIAAAAAESIIGHRSLVLLPDSGLLLHRDGMDLLRCLGNRGRMGDSLPWAARRAMKRRASHRRPTAAAAAGPQSTLQLFLPLVSALPRARWLRAFSCSTDAPSRVSSCPSCGFRTEIRDRAGGVWSDGRWHRRSNARRKREEQQRRWQLPDLSLSSLNSQPPLSLHSTRNLLSLSPPRPLPLKTGLSSSPVVKRELPNLSASNQTIKMGHADVWNSHNNDHSKGGRTCRVCGNHWGLVRKYGVNMCRQCFRAAAPSLGFVKYR